MVPSIFAEGSTVPTYRDVLTGLLDDIRAKRFVRFDDILEIETAARVESRVNEVTAARLHMIARELVRDRQHVEHDTLTRLARAIECMQT